MGEQGENIASQATAQRLGRIVLAVAAWLDEQYIQLGKKTIPLFNEVDDAFKALTDEDRKFLNPKTWKGD